MPVAADAAENLRDEARRREITVSLLCAAPYVMAILRSVQLQGEHLYVGAGLIRNLV